MNFDKMCRICAVAFKGRFETVEDNKKQIFKYLPIKDKDKDFPKNVCVDCLYLIESWNVFYNRCDKSQKKFAELLLEEKARCDAEVEDVKDVIQFVNKESDESKCPKDEGNEKSTSQFVGLNFSCNFCAVCTHNQQELNDHLIALHCDLVFCCDLCKNYKPRDDLITHMTEHALSSLQDTTKTKPTKEDKLKCPKCDKQFTSPSGLKYHMNSSHLVVKEFPCDECEQVFPCKRVLLNHVRSVHTKDKPFKCNDCGNRYKTDSTLYAHRKIHSKEVPHKCFQCGKGFKFKHHLDYHLMHHKAKEKIFECNCCHKKFTALNNLTKHRKVHDKTTDFACHICGVKLIQRRYLMDHMKRVHQTRLDSLDIAN